MHHVFKTRSKPTRGDHHCREYGRSDTEAQRNAAPRVLWLAGHAAELSLGTANRLGIERIDNSLLKSQFN